MRLSSPTCQNGYCQKGNNTYWQECGEMGALVHCRWERQLQARSGERKCTPLQCSCLENPRDGGAWWAAIYGVAQSWTWLKRLSSRHYRTVQRFLNKLKIELPQDPTIPLLAYSQRIWNHYLEWNLHPHVTASLFTIAKTWKQPLSPLTDEWIQKMWCVYTERDNDILFSHKRKEILLFAIIWMDLEGIMISEISQIEKDKYHMISLTLGIHKNQSWWLLEPRGQKWGKRVKVDKVVKGYQFLIIT